MIDDDDDRQPARSLWLRQDVLAGFMFVVFAGWGFAASWPLDQGSSLEMGPGYFPRLVSFVLLLLGVLITVNGLRSQSGLGTGRWHARPILTILLAALVFALLLQRAGIVIAIAATVLIGVRAGERPRPLTLAALTVGLILASIGLFVWGIGVPLPIWPPVLSGG